MSLPLFTQPAAPRRGAARSRNRRMPILLAVALALAAGVGAAFVWQLTRPVPKALEPPALTPALKSRVLTALGWPAKKPELDTLDGPRPAAEGRVESIAAADVDGDGTPEWAVAYTWVGPPVATGERASAPGFAVVRAGTEPEAVYTAPGFGGWNGPKDRTFTEATTVTAHVDTVDLGPDGLGFLQTLSVEDARGGGMAAGWTRLYVPTVTGWTVAWEGETEYRQQQGTAEETARTGTVVLQDIDQDGRPEILLSTSHYERHLDARGRGPHYTVTGPGQRVYRRMGERYTLAGLVPQGEAKMRRIRAQEPLFALRTSRPVAVDARFDEWDAQGLQGLTGMVLSDPALLMYKRRDRHGMEDCSGSVRLLWDDAALYVRATVVDNRVVPGVAGRDLYKGDHVALWIDRDLEGDFDQIARSDDDFQIGLSPGSPAEAFCWVPDAGRHDVSVASRPLVDPYSGGRYGYELEAAIPWSGLGGPPTALPVGPSAFSLQEGATVEWRLDAAMGIGVVLTDADERPQELAYVSNRQFGWARPGTFNTLLMVEPR